MTRSDDLFQRLAQSPFRRRFKLGRHEYDYCLNKGEAPLRQHAAEFIAQRLAPALPANDGKQTPMRGHPVFIAQHATATCCRGCLLKWHDIPPQQALSASQQAYVVAVIMQWIQGQMQLPAPAVKAVKLKPIRSLISGNGGKCCFLAKYSAVMDVFNSQSILKSFQRRVCQD